MRNLTFLPRAMALHMVMASAAAVPSSSRLALLMGIPVRSVTTVWKFSSDSSLVPTPRSPRPAQNQDTSLRPVSHRLEVKHGTLPWSPRTVPQAPQEQRHRF